MFRVENKEKLVKRRVKVGLKSTTNTVSPCSHDFGTSGNPLTFHVDWSRISCLQVTDGNVKMYLSPSVSSITKSLMKCHERQIATLMSSLLNGLSEINFSTKERLSIDRSSPSFGGLGLAPSILFRLSELLGPSWASILRVKMRSNNASQG